uniref:Ig-like domain-containing protein n=1 Tax=Pelusios castaneus TaxID=367368 RepID=A0A8C8VJZ7_9SAUR
MCVVGRPPSWTLLTTFCGQTLSLACLYNSPNDKGAKKAWCRWTVPNKCDVLVNTDYGLFKYQNRAESGRATIEDDTQKGVVTITMEKLQEDDSGLYSCARYYPPSLYRIVDVKLTVTKGQTFIILGVVLGLLLILALIGVVILCTRKYRQRKSRGKCRADGASRGLSEGFSNMTDPKDDKQEMPSDLKYATLDFKPRPSPKESVYANIMPSQALETPQTWGPGSEPVEYASISLQPLGAKK